MTKLNRARGPITTEKAPSMKTFEGAEGYRRDTRGELFLLAVSNFVGEETFYEGGVERDERYRNLVRAAAIADPDWAGGMIGWLRSDANMRAAPFVAAAEYAWARRAAATAGDMDAAEAGITTRKVISSSLGRLDEPTALINYWIKHYGRNIPKPVKRGVADAMIRLMSEYSFMKYDPDNASVKIADALNLTHPGDRRGSRQHFRGDWQRDLFAYAVKKPYQPDLPAPGDGLLFHRQALMGVPIEDRRSVLDAPEALAAAGFTWEALAGWLQGPMDAAAWEAIIPAMDYMALLRNLRNFDEAGVSDVTIGWVSGKLADPDEVAKSKQFPYRFLAAYEAVVAATGHNSHWEPCLNAGLSLSTRNIPGLANSVVLVDTSSSMTDRAFSARSKMTPAKAAAVFGVALAMKGDGNRLHGFATGVFEHELRPGTSFTRAVSDFLDRTGEVGHGTEIAKAIRETYHEGVERIIVITDEQTFGRGYDGPHGPTRHGNVTDAAPREVPIYVFNLSGYAASMIPGTANRHEFGGLTDATFKMISLIEAGVNADWPWARTPAAIEG